jgi:cob(I)alamin adenosyltransferase
MELAAVGARRPKEGRYRMTKIYTKTGDRGETGLFSGERVSKADPLVDAYGTVDELNSVLGVARSLHQPDDQLSQVLTVLQSELLSLGADLGSGHMTAQRISEAQINHQESLIDELTNQLPPLAGFILPGGHPVAAQLHHARTICRRAERLLVNALRQRPIDPLLMRYLNRLSDLLFTLARFANHVHGTAEERWQGK